MQDFILNENEDVTIINGDFKIGFSDFQHQKSIVVSSKGQWKQHPEVGVGIVEMIADDQYTEMLVEMKKQLEYDGMLIDDISFKKNGKIFIDGKYKE